MSKMIKPSQLLLAVAILVLFAGCARFPTIDKTPLKAKNLAELRGHLLGRQAELGLFRYSGPFDVAVQNDLEVPLTANERYYADVYFAGHKEVAPLVILVHGYDAGKDLHAYQAMHVASWGLHVLAIQLPKTGPWVGNGRILARVAQAIARGALPLDARIDSRRLILAGHSFGAAAVAIALAEGAPALGGIWLDPATTERVLPQYLGKVRTPVMILGADEQVTKTTNRELFFRFVPGNIAEVSVKDAMHEDAQFPSREWQATEALQITFASALTSAAMSLHLTGRFDYAWTSFDNDLREGRLLRPKRK